MARKPRLHENGGVYHVMLRGNGGRIYSLTTMIATIFIFCYSMASRALVTAGFCLMGCAFGGSSRRGAAGEYYAESVLSLYALDK